MNENAFAALEQRRQEFVKQVMSDDRSTASLNKKLTWTEAAFLYGDVASPLTQTLAHVPASGVTHTWRDLKVRAGTANVGTEAATPTSRGDGIPSGHSNTCQIFSDKVSVSGSAAEEARRGTYGPESDEVGFQTNYKMRAMMQDVEWTTLYGVEVTVAAAGDPQQRQMKGLVGTVGTWDGLIQTNRYAVKDLISGQDHLDLPAIDAFLAACAEQNSGEYIDTLLVSIRTATRLKALNTTAQFVFTYADLQQIAQSGMPAGTPIGVYFSPLGPIQIKVHPKIANDASVKANNFLIGYKEELVRFADFRELDAKPLAVTGDTEGEKLLVVELTLELLAEAHAGILHTFSATETS